MSKTAISVESISKLYRLGEVGTGTLSHDLNRWWHKIRGKEDPYLKIGQVNDRTTKGDSDYIWALRDISFTVQQGEVLGIIGRNGAGKSTLLKILSRVTSPTSGQIKVKGRIASLLEVGTGFHPELTGRENIYLNGGILGMGRHEITRKLDEIVAFAEIERYIDTPVKRYSSGMYVRLAFAVAAHLEPEILIVDEVLAVGDLGFQEKCLGKISEVAHEGRTVLFVSHNLSAMRTLCGRGILLETGRAVFDGPTSAAIQAYSSRLEALSASWTRCINLKLPEICFQKITLSLRGEQPKLSLSCDVVLRCQIACPKSFIAVDICDNNLVPIMQALPIAEPFIQGVPGVHRLHINVDLPPLVPSTYPVNFWIGSHYNSTFEYLKNKLAFKVLQSPTPARTYPHFPEFGSVVPLSNCHYFEHSQS